MSRAYPGDVVACDKGVLKHVGVVISENRVLHNTPERGEHISSLFDFCQGRPYEIRRTPAHLCQVVLHNASIIAISPRQYDVIVNNCEHTATRALGLEPQSQQLAIALLIISGLSLLFYLSRRA